MMSAGIFDALKNSGCKDYEASSLEYEDYAKLDDDYEAF
jgi:hypothetical protein